MISTPQISEKIDQKFTILQDKNISALYKPLIIIGFLLFLYYILVTNHHIDQPPLQYLVKLRQNRLDIDAGSTGSSTTSIDIETTNISHIAIGIAGSVEVWKTRKAYIESWWVPNVTRGYLFLDRDPINFKPWPQSSPPYKLYGDTSRYRAYDKHAMRHAIRMVRVIVETFREVQEGVRWYVMADDDTILFTKNLVTVLGKLDHTGYVYVGENSETVQSNADNSFEMAFGGAGYAISYPLAEALAHNMDVCIKRYPFVYGSDHLLQSCISDIGVSLTHDKGFHQIDLKRDLSGFLSSHPQTLALSLHHLDVVDPIFPNMQRSQALNHLMKASQVDQSRLFQQTICYQKSKNWSISISWGYSAHIYEQIIPPSVLQKPLETFLFWRIPSKAPYMFNTRWLSKNPCEMPHVFFLEAIEKNVTTGGETDRVMSSYTRRTSRNMPPCSPSSGVTPSPTSDYLDVRPNDIAKVIVISPPTEYNVQVGARRECCDVLLDENQKNEITIKYRACMKNEIVGVD